MKRLIIFILILTISITVYSQAFKAVYSYDANGNRVEASVDWLNSTLKSDLLSVDSLLPATVITKVDTNKIPRQGYLQPNHDSLARTKFTIYPNPTHGILLIQIDNFDEMAKNELHQQSITVYGTTGSKIIQLSPLLSLNSINLQAYSSGIYILVIQLGSMSKSYTIVKN